MSCSLLLQSNQGLLGEVGSTNRDGQFQSPKSGSGEIPVIEAAEERLLLCSLCRTRQGPTTDPHRSPDLVNSPAQWQGAEASLDALDVRGLSVYNQVS